MKKPFDQTNYEQNDNAKHVVVEFLNKWDFQNVRVNPDKYGIDLLCERNGSTYGVEVEVKHNWTGYEFPFASVHWPARKIKFLDECDKTYFVIVSSDRRHLLIANNAAFDGSRIWRKDTTYTQSEWFVEVPLEKCQIYDL